MLSYHGLTHMYRELTFEATHQYVRRPQVPVRWYPIAITSKCTVDALSDCSTLRTRDTTSRCSLITACRQRTASIAARRSRLLSHSRSHALLMYGFSFRRIAHSPKLLSLTKIAHHHRNQHHQSYLVLSLMALVLLTKLLSR